MNITVFGVNLSKRVFQVHSVDPVTGKMTIKQIKRDKFLEYFSNRAPCMIGMVVCGGARTETAG